MSAFFHQCTVAVCGQVASAFFHQRTVAIYGPVVSAFFHQRTVAVYGPLVSTFFHQCTVAIYGPLVSAFFHQCTVALYGPLVFVVSIPSQSCYRAGRESLTVTHAITERGGERLAVTHTVTKKVERGCWWLISNIIYNVYVTEWGGRGWWWLTLSIFVTLQSRWGEVANDSHYLQCLCYRVGRERLPMTYIIYYVYVTEQVGRGCWWLTLSTMFMLQSGEGEVADDSHYLQCLCYRAGRERLPTTLSIPMPHQASPMDCWSRRRVRWNMKWTLTLTPQWPLLKRSLPQGPQREEGSCPRKSQCIRGCLFLHYPVGMLVPSLSCGDACSFTILWGYLFLHYPVEMCYERCWEALLHRCPGRSSRQPEPSCHQDCWRLKSFSFGRTIVIAGPVVQTLTCFFFVVVVVVVVL